MAEAEESAATLLVGLPALRAGYLVRPGEHRLVGRFLIGISLLLVLLILLCVVAIGTLIGEMGRSSREWVWASMAAIAFGSFLMTGAAWLRTHGLER